MKICVNRHRTTDGGDKFCKYGCGALSDVKPDICTGCKHPMFDGWACPMCGTPRSAMHASMIERQKKLRVEREERVAQMKLGAKSKGDKQ